jgi:hypothetical protein
MGHPDAPDHDHHRSLWWGHHSVGGVNFWEERRGTQQVRQERWVHYQDGPEEAGLVVQIGWFDAHRVKLLQQELMAVYRPLQEDEGWLELQTTFTPTVDNLTLARTNFGFLGLRVAASMSVHFGGGRLTDSESRTGEPAIFGRQAQWMDYSGPIVGETWEGITWFDHPSNPNHPTSWHVRSDGWMSAAFNLREAYTLQRNRPLTLRYGFHIHSGPVHHETAEAHRQRFASSAGWELVPGERPWRHRLRRRQD